MVDNYVKSNFATDSDGKLCGVDAAGYEYVYFANPPAIVRVVLCSGSESVCQGLSYGFGHQAELLRD